MPRHSRKRQVVLPVVTARLCTGCGWCVAACPDHLLVLEVAAGKKSAELALPERCTGCAKCIPTCQFGAIRMVRQRAESPDVPASAPTNASMPEACR